MADESSLNLFNQAYPEDTLSSAGEYKPNILDDERVETTEKSPRVLSMLRFDVDQAKLKQYLSTQKEAISWPFLTLSDLKKLMREGLVTCTNINEVDQFVKSWNDSPLTNEQAEVALTTTEKSISEHPFALIPLTVQRDGHPEMNAQTENKFVLMNVDKDVLAPAEPTSTRFWLNLLYKHYDFDQKNVAEVFCGSSPAATMATVLGAAKVDSYDIMDNAIATSRRNFDLHNIPGEVIQSDVFDAASGKKYDIILANPPFNPKPNGENDLENLEEAVWDFGYQVLEKFLRQLPERLNKNGQAVVLYEDLEYGLDPNPTEHQGNAIEKYIDILNKDQSIKNPETGNKYIYTLNLKGRLRRNRGEGQPATPFVVYEITVTEEVPAAKTES